MIFFYIRHGEPIYNPDSLTPLGIKQAEAVSKRLCVYGIDKVFSSTSNRAIQTAQPTCDALKKDMTLLDFANEKWAWDELVVMRNGKKRWLFQDDEMRELFADSSVISLGYEWYNHPSLAQYKKGFERVQKHSDEFFKSLGYEHTKNTGKYNIITPNNERVALFAHQGFGIAFLSAMLDIPYPIVANHFDMCHSGVTAIEFEEKDGYAIPRMLTLSSDSHLYKENLPTKYNGRIDL